MDISSLDIPSQLKELLLRMGYTSLYPPQEEAIKREVLGSGNMLISSPTASGKTLLAILAAAQTVLKNYGKVVYLTPLRALAGEKYDEFKNLEDLKKEDGSKIRVLISTGDYDSSGESLGSGDILILTNEKFDSVLRHGASWTDSVKLYVADEIHLIESHNRGPTLEMILTKILRLSPHSRVLALSATVTNSKVIASWLGADLVDTNWRPVKLLEGIYNYGKIYFSDGSNKEIDVSNMGAAIDVALDILKENGQALIFAETRRGAVSLAAKASQVTRRFLTQGEEVGASEASKRILSEGEETSLSRNLAAMVSRGSAFHHAGLHHAHRRIVEESFRKGVIKLLTSTPTLAAGVNLPARRVVIRSLLRYDSDHGGQSPISILEYKQICGRAGRPQYDDRGEAVIISPAYADAQEIMEHYVNGVPEPIISQLSSSSALRTHILATIASQPGMTMEDLNDLFSRTLFALQSRASTIKTRVFAESEFLMKEDLVQKKGKRFLATRFGERVSQLYIDPATGVLFRKTLLSAQKGKTVEVGLLHLVVRSPDFSPRFSLRNKDWDEASLFVKQNANQFILPVPTEEDFGAYSDFLTEMRSLLALYMWIEESTEDRILENLGIEPGDLHRSVESADWLIHAIYEIARLVGREDLLRQISILRGRVNYGVKSELVPLTRLEGVGRIRARALYAAGYTDMGKIASAPVDRLAAIPKIGMHTAKKIREQTQSWRP